jgi:aminoglycoside phosphotransferase family enzyme
MEHVALFEALRDPAIYPEPTTHVEVRETHISRVFLTDQHAYKLKKPVDLGFLDFSTLERRRFFCEQELALNRRLSAGVYLDVVAVHQDGPDYTFEERGQVVEYALKMRRLPADRSLEALVQRGAVTTAMIEALAQRLAAFHAAHPVAASEQSYGTLAQVQADWEENFAQTADAVGDILTPTAYGRMRRAVTAFMARHADWFAQRVREGRIRECHGDLRAERIYFEPGQVQIIDGIEFNPRWRFIDVASEVAFLAVDLQRLGAAGWRTASSRPMSSAPAISPSTACWIFIGPIAPMCGARWRAFAWPRPRPARSARCCGARPPLTSPWLSGTRRAWSGPRSCS